MQVKKPDWDKSFDVQVKKPDWDKSFDVQVKKPVQCTSMAYDIVSCSSLTIIYLNMNINEVCLVLIVFKNMYFRWVTIEILRFIEYL